MPLTHIEAMYSTVPMVASQKCALIRPMLVELLDPGDVLVQAHVGEVGKLGGVGLAERMIRRRSGG